MRNKKTKLGKVIPKMLKQLYCFINETQIEETASGIFVTICKYVELPNLLDQTNVRKDQLSRIVYVIISHNNS